MLHSFLFILTSFFLLISCQIPFVSMPDKKKLEEKVTVRDVPLSDNKNIILQEPPTKTSLLNCESEIAKHKQEVLKALKPDLEKKSSLEFEELLASDHPLVQKWLLLYQKSNHRKFEKVLARGVSYRTMIEPQLKRNKLPLGLAYLPLIESGYRNRIRSKARAVGLWQFVSGTARAYGLKVNAYIDERRDPQLSTLAAIKYLKDLYRLYLDWPLALAAYNAGENRILRVIMTGKSRDYWHFVKEKKLPRETRNYLPKFIATSKIAMNPELYGFEVRKKPKIYDLVQVEIPPLIKLSFLSDITKISSKKLREFNPALLRRKTPPWSYKLWLPKKVSPLIVQAKKLLLRESKRHYAQHKKVIPKGYHRVRYGDSLYLIGRKYKLSVKRLKRMNHLRSNRIFPGTLLRVREEV